MPYFLLNHKYEVIAESDTNTFSEKGYMVIKADNKDSLHTPVQRKTISAPKVVQEWNFSLIPKHKRKAVIKLFEEDNFEKLKSIINQYNVSPAPLCCGENRKLITYQVKKAIENGNLEIQ